MNVGTLAILTMLALIVLLFIGMPVALALMFVVVIFGFLTLPLSIMRVLATSLYGTMNNEVFLAVPLFLLMAGFLQYSGIAENLFTAAYKWSGGLRGGLAVATLLACAVLASMTGIGATGVVTMGLIAYPQMQRYNYNKELSLGAIALGGALGPIIPPSNLMIILGVFASISVGRLFIAGVVPGLLICFAGIAYVIIRAYRNKSVAPAPPPEERATWREKFIHLRLVLAPLIVVVAVLGSIYAGIATVVEAASIGALATLIITAIYRRLTFTVLKDVLVMTLKTSVMVYWLIAAGASYSSFLGAAGVGRYISELLISLPIGTMGLIAVILVITVILGFFIESIAILMITIPIFLPVIATLGVDPIWFGTMYVIALTSGYITPPFGYNLFYLKGVVKDVTMNEIYRGAIPYAAVMMLSMVILFFVPSLVTWLPHIIMD